MSSAMVRVVITYVARPGQAERMRQELTALIETVVRTEPDCGGIHLLVDAADPNRILLIEYWTSADAFTGPHLTTPHLTAFRARAAEFIAGPPEVTYWDETAAFFAKGKGLTL
ncbi:MAG: antibiotic biosynthesis monooxygenase [Gemmatimonadetes bacterium]|nr:antibiotic biosynthesis monooxygenase [Gemmatimonadota bacterium]